jgi:hypothetical protein
MKNKGHLMVDLVIAAILAMFLSTAAGADATPCGQESTVDIRTAPLRPTAGRPLRIMAIAVDAPLADLAITGPDGIRIPVAVLRRGGPPWSLGALLERAPAGTYRVEAQRGEQTAACIEVAVASGAEAAKPAAREGERQWSLENEAFFAAWIEQLFDAPPEQALSFPSLEPILRDPARNFLHDYFGAGEDDRLPATPDCADLPYFLRAYFAWKVGLPIGYRACSRGSARTPPRCGAPTIATGFTGKPAPAAGFRAVMRPLLDAVHSGSARTALNDDATDFYPVPLTREALWPGTVYADPYGHVLMIAKWVPQTETQSGMLLAVDAQPDNSVARKRFWEGTFLFAATPGAGPGFKSFRPLGPPPAHHPFDNAELADGPRFAPYSDEQAGLAPEEFYARVGRIINPAGQDPVAAYEAMLDALVEQLETRVQSVENGARYLRTHPGAVIPMPAGAAIFETMGPWEDYSTPSRDLRLIIALNVLERLADRIVLYPELFVLNGRPPEMAREEIQRLHAQRLRERQVGYQRSDGSPWQLSLAEVYARKTALETAYNPNDCPEVRWGAQPGTPEYATCRRRSPPEQLARMEQYRPWFREARRPPR